jgi:hypothetical protein
MANNVINDMARRIAFRCLGIIEPLLRQEEKREAAREFYLVARDELEKWDERQRSNTQG